MKIDIPQRQRWLVIIAAIGVVLIVLDRVLFTPLTATWQAHTLEIARLQKSVTEGRGLIARAGQLDRTWNEMQANSLPKDPAQAEQDVISSFDRWGRGNNIELGSIRPQWKRGTDRYSLLECRVDATGTLSSLTHFLYELERSPLALKVESVELTARDDFGNKLTLGIIVSGLRLTPLERKL
jgi:hypothetical protein